MSGQGHNPALRFLSAADHLTLRTTTGNCVQQLSEGAISHTDQAFYSK